MEALLDVLLGQKDLLSVCTEPDTCNGVGDAQALELVHWYACALEKAEFFHDPLEFLLFVFIALTFLSLCSVPAEALLLVLSLTSEQ